MKPKFPVCFSLPSLTSTNRPCSKQWRNNGEWSKLIFMMYQRMSRYKKKTNTAAYRGYNKIFKLQEHSNLTEDGYLNRF